MNKIENGFPELTDSFLSGQNIFYGQFNDVEFYIEDTEQEHFYFQALKKSFPDIKFDKIFPLNGKKNVIDAAKLTLNSKKKIYIVDQDFDRILQSQTICDNLFYLKKYSIENYLISKESIFEIIREKKPILKDHQIENLFNYDDLLASCKILLSDLACTFIIIKKYELGLKYFDCNPPRDFNFTDNNPTIKNCFISNFNLSVEQELKNYNSKLTLNTQIRNLKTHFKSTIDALTNIPGKHLLNLIKYRLENLSLIDQNSLDSFSYRLCKNSSFDNLEHLKNEVVNYIR